jgi:hypothetical protein
MLQSLLDSDTYRSNTVAGIQPGSPSSYSAPLPPLPEPHDESRSMSCVGGGVAGALLPSTSALAPSCKGDAMRALGVPVTDLDAAGAAPHRLILGWWSGVERRHACM